MWDWGQQKSVCGIEANRSQYVELRPTEVNMWNWGQQKSVCGIEANRSQYVELRPTEVSMWDWGQHKSVCGIEANRSQYVGLRPTEVSMWDWGQQKTMKLVFAAPLLSTQHWQVRAMTSWPRIRIMCPNGMTCIPSHCSFSVPTLYKFHWACVSSTNRTSSLCHRYVTSSRHSMAEQLFIRH
jgi:hypothetical protein